MLGDWLDIAPLVGGGEQLPLYHFFSLLFLSSIKLPLSKCMSFLAFVLSNLSPVLLGGGKGEMSERLCRCLAAGQGQSATTTVCNI